ncbi:MAG TPA: MFS transporter [Steroidobacteraceae bacterium]|nr:MFS transporter [Steroidobacteraceae bacterium]
MNADPRETISASPMSALQLIAIAVTIGLNALDGFDVLSISFASPGIAAEWGIDRAALGIVLSMELFGMALGSIFLGGVADKIGRRRTILGCLVLMTIGMFMVTTVKSLVDLSIWRVITGLGIGGMLAAINAVAAEFSNARHRHMSVSVMAIGYPVGVVLGGLIVARLLKTQDWRVVFHFGAAITAAFIPLVYAFVPESVHWLTRKQPAGALDRINRTLKRMGHAAIASLPVISAEIRKRSVADIFKPGLIAVTVIVALAYFFHVTTFYFIIKWVPKIVVDMGFTPASAAGVLVWANVGGATGGALLGLLSMRFGIKALTITVMILSTVMVMIFGHSPPDLARLSIICAAAGFCTNAAIVGMYAIFAQAFPTHVRASGTGFAVGMGRGGAVLAPAVAGFLFKAGYDLPTVALMMSFGSLVAAGLILMLKLKPTPEAEIEATLDKVAGPAA